MLDLLWFSLPLGLVIGLVIGLGLPLVVLLVWPWFAAPTDPADPADPHER